MVGTAGLKRPFDPFQVSEKLPDGVPGRVLRWNCSDCCRLTANRVKFASNLRPRTLLLYLTCVTDALLACLLPIFFLFGLPFLTLLASEAAAAAAAASSSVFEAVAEDSFLPPDVADLFLPVMRKVSMSLSDKNWERSPPLPGSKS